MATSGMLTFLPGEVTNTVTVVVIGDTDDEGTETFTVELTGAVNATINKGTGTATIIEP